MEYSAEMLFSMIGDREHAVKRPKDKNIDRKLRDLVEQAQLNGELIINVGDGNGYWKADPHNPEDMMAYRHYINGKKSRVRKHARSIRAMEQTVGNSDQLDLFDLDDLDILEL